MAGAVAGQPTGSHFLTGLRLVALGAAILYLLTAAGIFAGVGTDRDRPV